MFLSDSVIRIAGVVGVTHHILLKCCNEFKLESGLYHHKTKKIVNNLLDTIIPLIKLTRADKTILEARKEGFVMDLEDVNEDVSTRMQCIEDFSDVLMSGDVNRVFNLLMALDNIKNNKRLYTEEEVNKIRNNESY